MYSSTTLFFHWKIYCKDVFRADRFVYGRTIQKHNLPFIWNFSQVYRKNINYFVYQIFVVLIAFFHSTMYDPWYYYRHNFNRSTISLGWNLHLQKFILIKISLDEELSTRFLNCPSISTSTYNVLLKIHVSNTLAKPWKSGICITEKQHTLCIQYICYYGYDCSRAMMLEINIPDAIYQNVLSAYFEIVFYGKESIILLGYAISCVNQLYFVWTFAFYFVSISNSFFPFKFILKSYENVI